MIGRSLANYRILEKLGEGGMGRVYLAEDTALDRRVALKILAPDVAGDPDRLERFRREAKAVAAISHPGIVAVHSVGAAGNLHFIAMEHVRGRNLSECAPEGGYSLAGFLRLALPLCEAVVAAHAAGVVHRDLKPGNVMVTDDGRVKILDFGLAKRFTGSGGPALTRVGELLGTVAYMAPEQIRGQEVDERTDLFALGVLFYEMAAGRHPFDRRDLGSAIMSVLHDRPRPVSAVKPELGTGLDPILARCLEKEPAHRYASAGALRVALAELGRKSADRTMTLEMPGVDLRDRRSPLRPEVWSLPRSRNSNFSGRDEELEELRRLLGAEARGVPTVAVVGLGGVGKTQLAVEFAYRFARDYATVWWLPAGERAGLRGRYAALARELGLETLQDVERTVAAVRRWLARNTGWLLVFDNAEDPSEVRPYLPAEGGGHVLVTSRNPAWRGAGQVLELSVWTAEQAAAYLERRTGDADAEAAGRLNEALGGLPLALEHAAAYIETSGQSVASYVRLFGEQRRRLLSRGDEDSSAVPVMATWDLSFRRLARDSPAAEQLLALCAFLAPDDIPLELLRGAGELLPAPLGAAVADELALDETLASLLHYSLVSRLEDSLSVHRLVQMAIRQELADESSVWLERALRAVSAAFPAEGYLDVRVWPRCSRLLPHALSCLGRLDGEAPGAAAQLLDSVGSYLSGRAQFQEARPYLERALEIEEAVHGPDHLQLAVRLNDLGRVLRATGDFAQASAHFARALAIEEAVLGPDHPNIASRLNNIATVLNDLDKPAEARALLQRALEIDEAAYGPDHPDVAHRLFNLAVTHLLSARAAPAGARQGDFDRARALLDRALRIYQEALGRDHLLVGKTSMNIGCLLIDRNELAEAKRWLERSVAIEEEALGPDHPELALCLKNLGEVHQGLGDAAEARNCFDRALAIEQEAYAGRHRELGLTLEHLGLLALEEDNAEEASLCLERALRTLEETVGSQHTDTIRLRGRLEELTS